MKRIISSLPLNTRKEMMGLWSDYENGRTREGRFVKQADKTINLLQGLIYWKRHGRIEYRLWVRRAKEVLDDPVLLDFLKILEKEFCKSKSKKK